jgi:hypothetical protein
MGWTEVNLVGSPRTRIVQGYFSAAEHFKRKTTPLIHAPAEMDRQ